MKSEKSGKFYLTFESSSYSDVGNPEQISSALGLDAEVVSSATIKRELLRAATNRADLVKDIADAVIAGVRAGMFTAPDVDYDAIARSVEARLVDEFDDIPRGVNDELDDRARDRLGIV